MLKQTVKWITGKYITPRYFLHANPDIHSPQDNISNFQAQPLNQNSFPLRQFFTPSIDGLINSENTPSSSHFMPSLEHEPLRSS
ncbi:MAG: hypothetical protein H8E21_10215 [Gammaproteobacteria bacterium]|nr:hypothetical protein [Gammaproteobacteria bacterium]MBL6998302.1 hypothetical protein [Gammaproteobacteria bacterium]